MYDAAYKAEHTAFTPRVIQRAFVNTGLFPFDPDKILWLAKQNAGMAIKKTRALYVKHMQQSVSNRDIRKPKNPAIKQGKVHVQASTLFDPEMLTQAAQLETWKKENNKKKKRKAKEEKLAAAAAK